MLGKEFLKGGGNIELTEKLIQSGVTFIANDNVSIGLSVRAYDIHIGLLTHYKY